MEYFLKLIKNKMFLTGMVVANLVLFGIGAAINNTDLMVLALCSSATFLISMEINSSLKGNDEK